MIERVYKVHLIWTCHTFFRLRPFCSLVSQMVSMCCYRFVIHQLSDSFLWNSHFKSIWKMFGNECQYMNFMQLITFNQIKSKSIFDLKALLEFDNPAFRKHSCQLSEQVNKQTKKNTFFSRLNAIIRPFKAAAKLFDQTHSPLFIKDKTWIVFPSK